MEESCNKGELWWGRAMDEEILNYFKNNPIMYRVGDKIMCKQNYYSPKRFLHETDDKLKRYYACHCSIKRQSILQDEGSLSNSLCYCCLGYIKKQFEAAFGCELTGRVLRTVLEEGCYECVFEIDIPDDFA
jgi:hypothetical protein